MIMLFWEREYFSKDTVKVSAPQWLWSGFYQGCADLPTPGQNWVWNSSVQIGLTLIALRFMKTLCFLLRISAIWFFYFTLLFEKHFCMLFLNCSFIISLIRATAPLCVSKLLHTGGECYANFEVTMVNDL